MAKKKAVARKKKATTSSAPSKRRSSDAPGKGGAATAKKKAAAKKDPAAKKVTKRPSKKAAAPATGSTAAAAKKPAVKKAPAKAAAPKKAASGKKAPASKKAAAEPVGKKSEPAPASAAPAASKGKKRKAPEAASSKGGGKPRKVEAAPVERYRSVYGETADQGAQAAASLLKAMGIDRPASTGPLPSDADGEATRLTKSPLKKQQLRKFEEVLRQKRAEIAGDVTTLETEALAAGGDRASSALSQHMADQGSDAYEQSLALDLVASQRDLIKEIDAALDRIERGTFGVCEATGRAINLERLENTPWARLSIDAARAAERMSFRR